MRKRSILLLAIVSSTFFMASNIFAADFGPWICRKGIVVKECWSATRYIKTNKTNKILSLSNIDTKIYVIIVNFHIFKDPIRQYIIYYKGIFDFFNYFNRLFRGADRRGAIMKRIRKWLAFTIAFVMLVNTSYVQSLPVFATELQTDSQWSLWKRSRFHLI